MSTDDGMVSIPAATDEEREKGNYLNQFEPIPLGDYHIIIDECTLEGPGPSGYTYLRIVSEIVEDPKHDDLFTGRKLFENAVTGGQRTIQAATADSPVLRHRRLRGQDIQT